MLNLQKILEFYKLLNKFRQIERMTLSSRGDRKENDAEHSYQMAMLAWYIISTKKLNYDLGKVLKYCLTHDIPEIYAGDTYVHTKDTSLIESKDQREEDALRKLRSEFKEFPELFEFAEGYKDKKDKEAIFVYALDKVEPMINVYLHKGRPWKEDNISLEDIITIKTGKVDSDKIIEEIYKKMLKVLKEEEKDLFN